MCKPTTQNKAEGNRSRTVYSSSEGHKNGMSDGLLPEKSPRRSAPQRRKRNGGNKAGSWSVPLTPPPPLNFCVAMDCEMVGIGPDASESALARVTIVNSEGKVIFDTFVRSAVPVTDYRTYVSGIRPADLESEKAMSPEECRSAVRAILRGKILVGHGLENDLWALGITHPLTDVRDTSLYGPYMWMRNMGDGCVFNPRKLRDLAWEELGMEIQVSGRAHSPVEDAIAALKLYKAARLDWEENITKQRKAAAEANHERRLERIRARSKHANEQHNQNRNKVVSQPRKNRSKNVRNQQNRKNGGFQSRHYSSIPVSPLQNIPDADNMSYVHPGYVAGPYHGQGITTV